MSKFSKGVLLSGMLATTLLLTTAIPALAATTRTIPSTVKAKPTATAHVKKGSHPISAVKPSSTYKPTNVKPLTAQQKAKQNKQLGIGQVKKSKYAPDSVIVQYKKGLGLDALSSEFRNIKFSAGQTLTRNGMQVLKIRDGHSVPDVVKMLSASKSVQFVQPNYMLYADDLDTSWTSSEPDYSKDWGLNNTGQDVLGYTGTPDIDIDADIAWTKTIGSSSVIVGVIDTGIDIDHPDLKDNIVSGHNFIDGTDNVYNPLDGDEHGTHVAGTIAGEINGLGVVGVAPNVKIMPLKFLGQDGGTTEHAIEAINYAKDHGVKVINASWGGGDYNPALQQAIIDSGIPFIAAAGNDGLNNDEYPHYPASYHTPNMVTVAALDNNGNRAWYSDYGVQSVDLAAPGDNIMSTFPRLREIGASVEVNDPQYKAVVQGFGLEELSPATATTVATDTLTEMGLTADSKILLVQDDQHDNGDPDDLEAYTNALAGYPNVTTVTVDTLSSGPSAANMQAYDAVIWFTGESWGSYNMYDDMVPNFLDTDISNLTNYLQAGGKLWISGSENLYGVQDKTFLNQTLHLKYGEDEHRRNNVNGVAGTAFDSVAIDLDLNNQGTHSMYEAADSAATVDMVYPSELDYSNDYSYLSGTSMATPHVTGVAALILSMHPEYSAVQVHAALTNTVKKLSDPWPQLVKSGGMVDAATALTKSPDDDIPGIPMTNMVNNDQLDYNFDVDDVYTVHLQQGEKLQASLTGATGTDFDLYLYDPTALSVTSSQGIVKYSENPGTSTEAFSYVAPQEGDYYVDVYDFKGTGAYTLTLKPGSQPGLYENSATGDIAYTGTWNKAVSDSKASGGNVAVVNSAGAADMFFYGNGVRYLATTSPTYGVAKVTLLDSKNQEVTKQYVDLSSATLMNKVLVFEKKNLPLDVYHLKIEWNNSFGKNGRKTATTINIDALTVLQPPTTVEESDKSITYSGTWSVGTSDLYSSSTSKFSNKAGSYAQFTFTGSSVQVYGVKGPDRGIAEIFIDGKSQGTVDLYEDMETSDVIFDTANLKTPLAFGPHTVKISVKGTKNIASLNTYVYLDSIVWGL